LLQRDLCHVLPELDATCMPWWALVAVGALLMLLVSQFMA